MSKDFFKGDELAQEVWKSKYQLQNESIEEFFDRITNEFSKFDNFSKAVNLSPAKFNELSDYGKSIVGEDPFARFHSLFNNFKYIIPGGSVLAGVGSNKPVSLSNCFVLDTNDSIEDIFNSSKNMSQIYKRRGGVGLDLSSLRPNGAEVNNAAKSTGGVVPFMELYSQVTNTIGQSGRRGALMLSIDINHPDSPDFITSKQNLTKITGANISVKLNDEFKKAVENDEDYLLRWPFDLDISLININSPNLSYNTLEPTVLTFGNLADTNISGYVKKIRAKELWDSIIQCAWNTAEPGILFWSSIIDNDPASVYPAYRAVSTNPCGEIPLSPHDSCRLIASNLYSLVKNPFTANAQIDEKLAYKVFYEAQIIGDILVDLELEAVQKIIDITEGAEKQLWENIKEIGQNGRRTGVGILGYGDMCAALGIPYGDAKITDYIMKLKMTAELDATIDLAIINGSFPAYDKKLEFNRWYTNLKINFPHQYQRMQQYGRRNISFSTIAPTGTISILAGTSSGCEPVFSLYYIRRKKCNPGETPDFIDNNGVGFKNFNVVHPKLNDWYLEFKKTLPNPNENPLSNWTKEELDFIIKFSPWHSNCAADLSPELRVNTQAILQAYTTHSISSTVNVEETVTPEFIRTIYEHAWNSGLKGITVYRDNCRSGILVKEDKKPLPNSRPQEIECQVMQFKNEKKDWVAFIGIINDKPYEIFSGPKDLDVFPIPSSVDRGQIIKLKQEDGTSRYDFRYIDSYGYTNTLGGLSRVFDKEYWNYGRLISALLRNELPIENIIKIIDGLSFTNKGMNNWKVGIIRALKVFIVDGTKVHGEVCDTCGGSNVVYESGCKICKDCGTSKCG